MFSFRGLPAILLQHPTLRRRYREIAKKRVGQFQTLLSNLSAAGLVIGEAETMLHTLLLPVLTEGGRALLRTIQGAQ